MNTLRHRRELMAALASLRVELSDHGIRDAADYAEVLVAESLGGQRLQSHVTKGHDVIAPGYGRVEVKCRQLPLDGRQEERVEIDHAKENGFEHLAVVIFEADFRVKGAVIVPYGAVGEVVCQQKYQHINYQQACRLTGACDITASVRESALR